MQTLAGRDSYKSTLYRPKLETLQTLEKGTLAGSAERIRTQPHIRLTCTEEAGCPKEEALGEQKDQGSALPHIIKSSSFILAGTRLK